MVVTLSDRECIQAVQEACNRMLASAGMGLNHATTYRRTFGERLREEIIGVSAEIALAKHLGVYRAPSLNEFHDTPDVEAYECRASHRDDACLIVRENDADDRRYLLAVGFPPTIRLCGWMLGRDAKCERFLRNPHGYRPAWFVPQVNLTPMCGWSGGE